MGRVALLAAACVAAVGLIVGCGSGEDQASAAPSKAQFVKQLDRFCKKTEQEKFKLIGIAFRAKAAAEPKWEPDEADLEDTTLKVVLPVIEKVPQHLAEVTPPEGDEDKVAAMVAAFEADIEKTEAEPGRFLESTAFTEGNEAAKAYGLDVCTF